MTTTEVLAGEPIRAADWNATVAKLTPYDVIKSANEDVTSSTTFQNDNELAFPVEANKTYLLEILLRYSGINSADMKYQWTGPSGCTFQYRALDVAVTDTTTATRTAVGIDFAITESTSSPYGGRSVGALNSGGGSPLGISIKAEATIRVGANSGTFQLQWAQNTSQATATTVVAGSWLRRTEMNV